MSDWMIYLIKVASFQAVMVMFYMIFLRRLTFYGFNRAFLIGALSIGFLLPLVHVEDKPVYQANEELVNMIGTKLIAEPIQVMEEVKPSFEINWTLMLLMLYGLGVLLLTQRFLSNFNKIRKFKYGHQLINKIGAIEVFRTPFAQPFSFFKSVFIPQQVEETPEMELVMAHELQHVRFGHSYDRMLVDFMIVLLWFNPFIYLLRKCLIEVHEYQVDAAVTSTPQSRIAYQMSLVSLAGGGFSGPVSFFNFSTIKRRIQMMNRNKSSKVSLMSLTLLFPMLFGLVVLFSFKMKSSVKPLIELPTKVKVFSEDLRGEKPSIFPVSTDEGKIKVSSTFGMRTHPIDKERQMHRGIDIAGKTGTSIIAAGDGEVVEVENQPNGYGKFIVIKHDDTYKTKYAQLSEQLVKVGDQVKKGQKIAEMGSSGKSTAPHLHYEVMENGKPVDPVKFINNYSFSQVRIEQSRSLAEAEREAAEKQALLARAEMTEVEKQRIEAARAQQLAELERKVAEESLHREAADLQREKAELQHEKAELQRAKELEQQSLKESMPMIIEVPDEVEVIKEQEFPVVVEQPLVPEVPVRPGTPEIVEEEIVVEQEYPVIMEQPIIEEVIHEQEYPVIREVDLDKDKNKNKSKDKSKEKSKDKEKDN